MNKIRVDLLGKMVCDLDGNPVIGGEMHKIVANAIAVHKAADPVKVVILAQDVYKQGIVELDSADYDIVEQAVRGYDQISPYLKGQILVVLKDAKDGKKPDKQDA